MVRLGILTTHPIQYHAPWFRHLGKRHDLTVYYAHRQDAEGQSKAGFGVEFEWDVPLLDGYHYEWLTNVSNKAGISTFAGCDTPEIGNHIASNKFDAFLVSGWNKKCYWQAMKACKRSRTPIFCRGDSQLLTPRPSFQTTLKYIPYRLLLPRFDVHLFVGERNREYLRHYGVPDSKLVFAPHFVDNDFFRRRAAEARESGEAERVRAECGIPKGAFVLLYVGKFIAKKRVADILDATIQILRDGHSIHLLLVGDGPLRLELEHCSRSWRSNIHFEGFVNQNEISTYYAASSAIVLASDGEETWGLSVNEAMACGLPAIVSDAVGCGPDLVDKSATGLTFPVGNTEALSRQFVKLVRLCEDSPERIRNSLRAKSEHYSMERASNGLRRALERAAGDTP